MRRVTLNFIWFNQMIGEIKLVYGEQSINTNANNFLNSLHNADSISMFKHLLHLELNSLA